MLLKDALADPAQLPRAAADIADDPAVALAWAVGLVQPCRQSTWSASVCTTLFGLLEAAASSTAKATETAKLVRKLIATWPEVPQLRSALALALALSGGGAGAADSFAAAAALPPAALERAAAARPFNLLALQAQGGPVATEAIAAHSDGGGWGGASPSELAAGEAGRCDIDRRSGLSLREFEEKYVAQGRPVLLPLSAVFDADLSGWTRAALSERHGDRLVTVTPSSMVTTPQYVESQARLVAETAMRNGHA